MAPSNNVPATWRSRLSSHATHHGRDARRTWLSRTSGLSLRCPFAARARCVVHRASASLVLLTSPAATVYTAPAAVVEFIAPALAMLHSSLVQAMYAAREHPSADVLHALLIYEDHVNTILRWSRLVVLLRRCHVQ